MKLCVSSLRLMVLIAFLAEPVFAQTLYYDTNGSTGGTNTSSSQNLTDAVWTIDPTGSIATTVYTPGSDIVFSANDLTDVGTGTQKVTISDAESIDGITVNNGALDLVGTGSPALSLGAGGIALNSNDGSSTFDSTLGTITLTADQHWNNNSTQAFNVNSNVTGSGNTLTLAGDGSGNVNLNGQLSGALNLTESNSTSTVYLNGTNNNFSGTITIDGGGLVFNNQGSLANNNITLSHGGVLESANEVFSTNNDIISNNITLGAGGGAVSGGVVGSYGNDTIFSGTFTGGTGLSVVNGDFITQFDGTSDVGTLTVTGPSRLLVGDAGIFGNNAIVDVNSTLDFGWNNYQGTLNNTINLANGSSLEIRGGNFTPGMNLTGVVFPTGNATVTLGSDDVGGAALTIGGPGINITNGSTLTLVLNAIDRFTEYNNDPNQIGFQQVNSTPIYLGEKISGTGNLTITPETANIYDASVNGQVDGTRLGAGVPLFLTGNNDYSGTTTIDGATVYPEGSGFGTSTVILNSFGARNTSSPNVTTVELTGGDLANHFVANIGSSYINSTSADQTLSGPIDVFSGANLLISNIASSTLTVSSAMDVAGGAGLQFQNYSSGNLIVGSIDLEEFNSDQAVTIDAYGTGNITFAGTYVSPANAPQQGSVGASTLFIGYFSRNSAADYYVAPTADISAFEPYDVHGKAAIWMFSGNLYLENSSFVLGQYIALDGGGTESVNVVGSQNINASIYNAFLSGYSVNQTTADNTEWNGGMTQNGAQLTLSVVAGGRLDISGDLSGGVDQGPIVTGNGVVVLSNPNGNDYTVNSGVTADLQSGTTLITNTNNGSSAFGWVGRNSGIVKVENGATLGGTGYSQNEVVSMSAGSVIAPGDPGQANLGIAPKIGILHLWGNGTSTGLTTDDPTTGAANGVTLDFKLSATSGDDPPVQGIDNDAIDFAGSLLTLDGPVTINLSQVGTGVLVTDTFYLLMFSSIDSEEWSGTPNVTIIAPEGYAPDYNFNFGDAYIYDTGQDLFEVKLVQTPEPSTYGLLGLGLLTLVTLGRFRCLRA